MRYPPLLVAVFLAMMLKPFADRFGSFTLPGSSFFMLLIFSSVIYAFRHTGTFVVCIAFLAAGAVTLRFVGDHWSAPVPLIISHGLAFITMVVVMIAILSEVLSALSARENCGRRCKRNSASSSGTNCTPLFATASGSRRASRRRTNPVMNQQDMGDSPFE